MRHFHWNKQWKRVIFSDDNRLNLDGPDGCKYHWHEFRKERRIFFSRHSDGGGLMICGEISSKGATSFCIIDCSMNKERLISILEDYLLQFSYAEYGAGCKDFMYMQDNASFHIAREFKAFKDKKINTFPCPALSPELNPIENVWCALARKLYANRRLFNSVEELKDTLLECWDSFTTDFTNRFVLSMPQRFLKLVKIDGQKISY